MSASQSTSFVMVRFVRGKKPGQGTGFDIDDADLLEMEQCRGVVVASAIFGICTVVPVTALVSFFL